MRSNLRSRLCLLVILTTMGMGNAQQKSVVSVSFFPVGNDVIARDLKLQPATGDERIKALHTLFGKAGCEKGVFEQKVPGSIPSVGCETRSTSDAKIVVLAPVEYEEKSADDAVLRWGDLTMLPILAESLGSVLTRHHFVLVAVGGKNDGEEGASEYLKQLSQEERKKIDAVIAFDHLGRGLPVYRSKKSAGFRGGVPPLIRSVALSAHALNLPEPAAVYGASATVTKPFDQKSIQSITFSSPGLISAVSEPGTRLDFNAYNKTYLLVCSYLLFLDRLQGQALPAPSDKVAEAIIAAGPAESKPATPSGIPADATSAGEPVTAATAPVEVAQAPAEATAAEAQPTPAPESGTKPVPISLVIPADYLQPGETIESNVRVVLMDVVVTDKDGTPVTGLKGDDFKVFEDGKQQTISSFKEHEGAPVKVVEHAALPPNTYTNFQALENADAINVILMDSLNTDVADQDFVHQQIIKYLKTIPPGARVGIFTLSSKLRMVQEFTTDSTRLLAALNDPSLTNPKASGLQVSQGLQSGDDAFLSGTSAYGAVSGQMTPEQRNLLINGGVPGTSATEAVDPLGSLQELLAEESLQVTTLQVQKTLTAFQQLARYLSSFPGRKNVMWVSGGFPLVLFPSKDLPNPSRSQQLFREDMVQTAALCTAAQMAIYPISALGLKNSSIYEANANSLSSDRPSTMTQTNIGQMNAESQRHVWTNVGMEDIAKTTGGQAFYDTNGLKDVLGRVTNEGMHYYTLSYTPTNTKLDNRFRQTRVEVTRGKYKLAYRRGYYATDAKALAEVTEKSDPLLPMMGFGLPDMSQLIYTLQVNPGATASAKTADGSSSIKGPTTTYRLDFGISPYHLKIDTLPDGKRHIQLAVRVIVYDLAGKPLNMVGSGGSLTLTPAALAEVQANGIHIPLDIELPVNANVHLRSGVYDMASRNAGTLGIRLRTSPVKPVAVTN